MPDLPPLPSSSRVSGDGGSDDPPFGERIRAMRKAANLTLEKLSAASGVSRAALSRIERGEMSPTYDSLLKLARGLGTDVAALVSGRRPVDGDCDVTRAGEGPVHRDARFTHRMLAPALPQRSLIAFVTEVHAHSLADYEQWDSHDSEDLLHVLDGRVEVHLEDRDPVVLEPGDSMQIDGRIAHALVALPGGERPGESPMARMLWVSVPVR